MADEDRTRIEELTAELELLKEELRHEKEKRLEMHQFLTKREPLLVERIKEISCIYSVISIITDDADATEEERLREAVKIIPTGWRDPSCTWARILLEDKEYRTGNFKNTFLNLSAPINRGGRSVGTVEVGYTREMSEYKEGPFLLEEKALIDIIARILSLVVKGRKSLQT